MVKLSSDINLRDFGNNEYLSSVQDESIRFATEQTDEILSLYGQHADTEGGRYVCADTFKELFPAFENKEDRATVNNAIHNSAAVLSSTQFDEVLKRDEPQKKEVIFVTGIPGSGKTSTVKNMMMQDTTKLLFEGQLARPQSAFRKIEQCLDRGLEVTIVAVSMRAERASDNTYKRFNEYGRGASIGIMADIQANLPNGLSQIRDKFGDAVKIVGINQDRNSEFIDKFDDVIKMLSLGSQEQILGRLAEKIQSDFDSGKISRECFNQAKGSMDLESIFAQKEYSQQRVVANSEGATLQRKSGDIWQDVEKVEAKGMKASIYLLDQAKKAEAGQTYSGEIIYKDTAAVFQKTKNGLVRHNATHNEERLAKLVEIGQKVSIGSSKGKLIVESSERSEKKSISR
ncbi:TPA: KfrB domain-containing protein [Neisseria subflava]